MIDRCGGAIFAETEFILILFIQLSTAIMERLVTNSTNDYSDVELVSKEDEKLGRNPFKALKQDIQQLMERLEKPPTNATGIFDIRFTGYLYRKRHNDTWKKYYCELDADQLCFYSSSDTKKRHSVLPVVYVYQYNITREDELAAQQIDKGRPVNTFRILLVSHGRIVRLAPSDETDAKSWEAIFHELMVNKYAKQELEEKEEVRQELMPLLDEQEQLIEMRYRKIMEALNEAGFFISQQTKKEKEGHLELLKVTGRETNERKKLYGVLYKGYFYLFKPHHKTSFNSIPYALIDMRYVSDVELHQGSDAFIIKTPLRSFDLKAKHQVATTEWVNSLNAMRLRKDKVKASAGKEQVDVHDKGYRYLKNLEGRISLHVQAPEEGAKLKTIKPKGSSITIGRSSTNQISVDDKYISRNHSKIDIEGNIPYVVDLGSSRGTKLNGKRVTKAPLKPGDVIRVGKTNITFDVKDKETIFTMSIESARDAKGRMKDELIALDD